MIEWDDLIEKMEELATVDVRSLTGPELCAGALAARRLRELADRVEVHVLGELEVRQHTDAEHGRSTAAWFAHHASLPTGVARRQVALADGLQRHLGEVDAAWGDGRINGEHVRAMHDATNRRNVDRLANVQGELIARVAGRTFRRWHRDLREAASRFDDDGGFDPNEDLGRNRATIGRTGDLASLRAKFTDEYAEPVAQAIDAKADELFHRFTADHTVDAAIAVPSRATLRALALAELVRGGRAVDARSTRPPQTEAIVVLHPDRPAAAQSPSWTATSSDGQRVSLRLLESLLCDGAARALVVDADGNPMNLGRTQRLASPAQRRALIVRDGGCAFPGCDGPPSWCDAHHVRRYDEGGPTDIANLVLLCRRHHGVTHRTGWSMHATADQWFWWTSPSGATFWSQRHGHARAGPAPPGEPSVAAKAA